MKYFFFSFFLFPFLLPFLHSCLPLRLPPSLRLSPLPPSLPPSPSFLFLRSIIFYAWLLFFKFNGCNSLPILFFWMLKLSQILPTVAPSSQPLPSVLFYFSSCLGALCFWLISDFPHPGLGSAISPRSQNKLVFVEGMVFRIQDRDARCAHGHWCAGSLLVGPFSGQN